ncbi:MAG TPA: M14 family metallopeptidase [Acidimicrobiales bacterium]
MPTFDRFLRYDELTAELQAMAAGHADLLEVESIGRSYEGRDLWLATVTDRATGAHDTKPAHWVDANIHATEVTGSVAALHLLHHLVTGFGHDEAVTRALRTRTFYVVPRVNPDGAELALADHPRLLRSSVRRWPWQDGHVPPGLDEGDVDGDGRILTMRLPDPHGAWRSHPDEPRLLCRRRADEPGGEGCYRLLREGWLRDHDGFTIPTPRTQEGLDLNRNFPAGWGQEVAGPGDFPGSEPEILALMAAVVARPNVCGYNAYHTSGGVLLRPSSTRPDRELPPIDVRTWTELGRRGTELTAYPVHSVYEDFTWDQSKVMSGAADDWAYEHLGIYSWTTEFWDVIAAATDQRSHTDIWVTGPTPEQELAVLRWADEHHPGEMFVEWHPFEHPQLGPIELGGWDWMHSWANPPSGRLPAEVAPHAEFAVFQALAAPAVEVLLADSEPLGDGTWRVRAGIANTGWLPTTVTERARANALVLPAVVELTGPADLEVIDPPARREVGQLAGRSELELRGGRTNDGTPDRAVVTWTVRAGTGTEVVIVARHQRGGRAERALRLS